MNKTYSRGIKYTLLLAALLSSVIGTYYWHQTQPCNGIVAYNATRDRQAIIELFKKNWHWLVPEESDFSIEYYLDHRAPSHRFADQGISKIMVYCIDGKPIGMTSFYLESFYKGILHFIVIDEPYRGKGYSNKLLQYALDDLQKQGVKKVKLITRIDNAPAKALYKKFGFNEFWNDDRFVRLEKEF